MDRAEFLNRLEAQLLDVPQAEREEALQYYEDYLNDAGDAGDFDILQELGTPEESRILSGTDCGRIAATRRAQRPGGRKLAGQQPHRSAG